MRVVEVDGELDILTAPKLVAAVAGGEAFEALVLDLGKVPFMSCAGLAPIAALNRRLSRRGSGLALAAVTRNVERLLKMTAVAPALAIAPDVPAAIAMLAEDRD